MLTRNHLEYGSIGIEDQDKSFNTTYTSLSRSNNNETNDFKGKTFKTFFAVALVLCGLSVFLFGIASTSSINVKDLHKQDVSLFVTVSNEYGNLDSTAFPYPWLDGSLFAETYKTNSISISPVKNGCIYNWEIIGVSDQISNFYMEGSSNNGIFTFEPTTTGQYSLSISEYCDNTLSQSYKSFLWSKYVRRELSALTDRDREEFLDAFVTLWKVKTPEGKKLYGDDYKSIWHFAVVHNDAGASPVCDEFHTGSGFINNHMYLGQYLEQNLRLINPRVSLHYMEYANYFSSHDFFYNHVNKNMMDGGNWSELFTSKWFGSNDPYTGKIINGRWADLEIPYVTDDFLISEGFDPNTPLFTTEADDWLAISDAHMKSPYGLLRSPWNWNPATYTVRYNNVNRFNDYDYFHGIFHDTWDYMNYYTGVTCDDYKTFMNRDVNGLPLYNFLQGIEDDVHGKVHFSVGGSGGDKVVETSKYIQDTYGLTALDMVCVAQSTQKYFKTLGDMLPGWEEDRFGPFPLVCSENPWQNGVLSTTKAPGEEGGPSCTLHSYYTSSEDTLSNLIDSYFMDWTSDHPQYATMEKIYALSFEEKKGFMTALAGQFQFDGDMAGSGAAHDPVFWVVHGGVERLMQKVYFEGTLSDYEYVNGHNTCSGHTEHGTKDWLKGYYFEDKSIQAEKLTNTELMEYLDPRNNLFRDNVNFVYDHSDWETTMCDGVASEWFDQSNFS